MVLIKKKEKINKKKLIFSIIGFLIFSYLVFSLNNFEYSLAKEKAIISASIEETPDPKYIPLNNIIIYDNNTNGKFTYIVQPGDTLSQIAYKFGISVSTLKSVNKLKSDIIKPGQKLIITEEEGILYEIPKNITLKQFATKYNLNLEKLKQLNYFIEDDILLQKGDEIFIPITEKQAIAKGLIKKQTYITKRAPSIKTKKRISSTKRYTYKGRNIIAKWYYAPNISNGFYRGHCTWYVAIKKFPYITKNKQKKLWNGNAKNWYNNAKKAGYPVGKTPKVGSIVVLKYGGRYYRNYGHVAIVLEIDWKNKRLLIEEMNAIGRFIVTRRWIPMDNKIIGYIYL